MVYCAFLLCKYFQIYSSPYNTALRNSNYKEKNHKNTRARLRVLCLSVTELQDKKRKQCTFQPWSHLFVFPIIGRLYVSALCSDVQPNLNTLSTNTFGTTALSATMCKINGYCFIADVEDVSVQ